MLLPKVIKSLDQLRTIESSPIDHVTYSSFTKFCTNPIMFKILYMNMDKISTTSNVSGVVGKGFHTGMEAYYGAIALKLPEEQAMEMGLRAMMDYIKEYPEGWIEYSTSITNRARALELATTGYQFYVQEKKPSQEIIISCEELIELYVDVEWRGKRIRFPVKLKGYIDKIVRKDGKLKIVDYKTSMSFSDPDKIDGKKIIQAIQYYFLVYAATGEEPYSMIFEEVKLTKNAKKKDGSIEPNQVKEYEIVYAEAGQFFEFYFRLYEDMMSAVFENKMVFVPNLDTFFDNEVSIISYIHRLDEKESLAREMAASKVENITDLLKKKLASAGSMKKFLATAEKKFISAKSLNYSAMKIEERIQTKLMEHGMMIKFESKIDGYSFDMFQFTPSIGLKMNKLKSYAADIEQVVGVSGIRILAPIPNTTFIGFEIPKTERRFPEAAPEPARAMEIAIGADIYGKPYIFDLRQAPHMLVAGATGSGKSVFLNSIIEQIAKHKDQVDLHLFDPKMVELSRYKSIAKDYQCDAEKIYEALAELVIEMNSRYEKMATQGARNISECTGFKYKVIVIDEFGDITIGGYKTEKTTGRGKKAKTEKLNISEEIMRMVLLLAQKARAAGIHMIIATQRPSTDIINGTVKANFPTKVAFRTAKEIDSRVLLDEAGAEKLLGKGDMIFSSDAGQIRLQGYNS